MAIQDDDLLYVQRPSGVDAGGYKLTAGNLKSEIQETNDDRYLCIDADAPDQTRVDRQNYI